MRTVPLILITALAALGADTTTILVSATNPNVGVAPDSLATIYGDRLATQTASAPLPWPTMLGDIPGVTITDSQSVTHTAPLLYVSPTQINLWIPPGVAPGPATVAFPFTGLPPGVGAAALRITPVNIGKFAPGLFSADGSGTGVAAATATRTVISTKAEGPVPVFTCDANGKCTAVPIDLGVDAPVRVTFYGTGFRGAGSISAIIGGKKIEPLTAGPNPSLPGLDQVVVPLDLSLRGSGLVPVMIGVDGVLSNAVQIAIQ